MDLSGRRLLDDDLDSSTQKQLLLNWDDWPRTAQTRTRLGEPAERSWTTRAGTPQLAPAEEDAWRSTAGQLEQWLDSLDAGTTLNLAWSNEFLSSTGREQMAPWNTRGSMWLSPS